jgi:hypothetical protein
MEQCASMLIGEDPFRTDRHWQMMYRGYFYPAGREKAHALADAREAGIGFDEDHVGALVEQRLTRVRSSGGVGRRLVIANPGNLRLWEGRRQRRVKHGRAKAGRQERSSVHQPSSYSKSGPRLDKGLTLALLASLVLSIAGLAHYNEQQAEHGAQR